MSDSSLTWVIALGVITVVVSCCVLYAIRQVFSLTEKVNKSQSAVSQLEEMQTQLKVLQEVQLQQKKLIADKEAEEERRKREKESEEARNNNSQEKLVVRLENLEKGLIEHEAKVEDAVNRAFVSDGRTGRGVMGTMLMKKSNGGLGAAAKKLMSSMQKSKAASSSPRGGGGADEDLDHLVDGKGQRDDDDDDDDTKSILDMSVLDFAKIMQATNGGAFGNTSSATYAQFSPSGPLTNNSNAGYVPSPMFRQLLEHGSLSRRQQQDDENDPLKKLAIMSPSNGVFASNGNSSNSNNNNNNLVTSLLARSNNPSIAHQQRMMIINSFLSRTNAVGGNGVLRQPPSFWTYEKSFSAAGSLCSLKRRLHTISFIIGAASESSDNADENDDRDEFSPSSRSKSNAGKSALVLKFAMAESVSSNLAESSNRSTNESPTRSSTSSLILNMYGDKENNNSNKFQQQQEMTAIDMGLPADGAGPGVLAIPLLSITLVEISVVSPFSSSSSSSSSTSNSSSFTSTANGKDILDAFSYVCGVGVPILSVRIEHRGELGEWKYSSSSPTNNSMRNNSNNNSNVDTSSGWTRSRALQKASMIPNASARGTAATAFTFYIPFSKSNAPTILHYVEYLRKLLDHIVAIDDEARRILVEAADRLISGMNSSNGGGGGMNNNMSSRNDGGRKRNQNDDLSLHQHLL